MSTTGITSLQQISDLAEALNSKPAAIEAACIRLLPRLEDMTPTDQAELLWRLTEAIGTNPARQDEAAALADEAWQLALEDNNVVLTVKARCAYVRFTARDHTTLEDYLEGLNKIGFLILHEWDPNGQLSGDAVDVICRAQQGAYSHGTSLALQGVLKN